MNQITLSELIALAAVVLSIGTNVGLYVHLSATMNSRFDAVDRRFDSVDRRLELVAGNMHALDLRLTKIEHQ